MILDRKSFDRYSACVSRQAAEASRKLEKFISKIDFSGGYEEKKAARNSIIEYMQHLVDAYGDAAATLAADFYNEIAEKAGVEASDALLADRVSDRSIANSVRYGAKSIFGETVDAETFARSCAASLERYVKQQANETMIKNAVRDGGAGVKFARVPRGAETCAFCMMLAGRGFVYANSKTAGEFKHFHDHCDCKVIAGFGDAAVEGHDPKEYGKLYDEAVEFDIYGHVAKVDTVNAMRRNAYDDIKDDRNERRRKLYAEKKGGDDGSEAP